MFLRDRTIRCGCGMWTPVRSYVPSLDIRVVSVAYRSVPMGTRWQGVWTIRCGYGMWTPVRSYAPSLDIRVVSVAYRSVPIGTRLPVGVGTRPSCGNSLRLLCRSMRLWVLVKRFCNSGTHSACCGAINYPNPSTPETGIGLSSITYAIGYDRRSKTVFAAPDLPVDIAAWSACRYSFSENCSPIKGNSLSPICSSILIPSVKVRIFSPA